jgi:hypothetical protein
VTAVLAALASVALSALIAVAADAGSTALLAVAVAVGVLALALGWATLLELPSARGTATVVAFTGWVSAAIGVRAVGMTRPLAPFAALLALAVLLAFGHELLRRHGRPHLVESVTGTLSGEAVALLGGGWVLLPSTGLGVTAVVTVATAVAGARLAGLLPVPPSLGGWLAWVLGTAAGLLGGIAVQESRLVAVAVVAAVVSAVVAGLDRLFVGMPTAGSVPAAISSAAAPVLTVGTVAYALARFLS